MAWAEWVCQYGPTSAYNVPDNHLVNVALPWRGRGRTTVEPQPSLNSFNYPPLSAYLLWLQGQLWRALDGEVLTRPIPAELARFAEPGQEVVRSRVVNTVRSRAAGAAAPVLCDLLMAWGVARLVRLLRARPWGWPETIAFGLMLLGPPMALNSAYWTQLDSCLTCLLVGTVYFLAAGRPAWAGVCYGAALMTKAQALLLLLVVALAAAGSLARRRTGQRPAGLWELALATVLTVAAITAPQAIADWRNPNYGSVRWFHRSYVVPIGQQHAFTTLKAFNIWWLDFLNQRQNAPALDPRGQSLFGWSKETISRVALLAGLAIGAGLCLRRWHWETEGWVAYAFLALLAGFLLPTRVHERFIEYCLPFAVASGMVFRRWLVLVVTLFLVGSYEMTWFLWLAPADCGPDAPAYSPGAARWSLILALLTLGSFLYALAALLPRRNSATPGSGRTL